MYGLQYGTSYAGYDQEGSSLVVTTGIVSIVRKSTALVSNNSSSGGSNVTERGLVIGTSISPTTSNTKYTTTGTSGDFDISLVDLTANTRYYIRAYVIDDNGTSYGPNVFFTTASVRLQKSYIYRVYDGAYVTTWSDEVLSVPEFSTDINGGAGSTTIQLARSFDSFGESSDVKLNNKVEIWVVDEDQPNGLLLYSGYISGYRPIINNQEEYVEVTLFSYIAEFARFMLKDGTGATTLTYNSYDPTDILEDVITKYRALGGTINFSATSLEQTNTTVSYTFNTNTVLEAVNKIIELCPVGWYWRVDPDNTIYLQSKNDAPDHTLFLGKEVEEIETDRRMEDLVNTVYFVGGGDPPLYRKYLDQTSIISYGRHEKIIVDERVTVTGTAQTISNRILNQQKDPEVRTSFVIVDGNGPTSNFGYDIENVKVGDTVIIRNVATGLSTIQVVQILSIDYSPDSIDVEASSKLPKISKRIEDVNRNLENNQTVNNPSSPS